MDLASRNAVVGVTPRRPRTIVVDALARHPHRLRQKVCERPSGRRKSSSSVAPRQRPASIPAPWRTEAQRAPLGVLHSTRLFGHWRVCAGGLPAPCRSPTRHSAFKSALSPRTLQWNVSATIESVQLQPQLPPVARFWRVAPYGLRPSACRSTHCRSCSSRPSDGRCTSS